MSVRARSLLGIDPGSKVDFLKAITTASAPTLIQPKEAERLIDYIIDESKLWKLARVVPLEKRDEWLREIRLTNGMLRPSTCGHCDDTVDVEGVNKQWNAKWMDAVAIICDDMLKTNLEGEDLEEHVLRMVAEQIGNELELIALMASTALNYTNAMVNNAAMQLFDGWYEQLKASHVIDANLAVDGRCLSICKFGEMMKQMPTKYRKNKEKLRYFQPSDMFQDYLDILAHRGTPLGDAIITGKMPAAYGVTGIEDVPLMPTNMTNCISGSIQAANGTFMFLTDPKNLGLGIHLEMKYERERQACNHRTLHIYTIAADFMVINTDAAVLYDCMQICECANLSPSTNMVVV
jgi:hypothetical protein